MTTILYKNKIKFMKAKKKILIIDDDRVFLQIMSRKITGAGYEVLTAVDGIQGITLALKEQPQLIILDIRFPAGGGLETLKKLSLSAKTCTIPIIISTCLDDPQMKQMVSNYNVVDYLVKPVDPERLVQKINETLKDLV